MEHKFAVCYPFLGKFRVNSLFGPRTAPKTNKGHGSHNHMGMDLAALNGEGTPVVAISAGKVTRVAYQSGYGNYVWIAQADGYGTVYGHLKRAAVKVGEHVNCRQVIGYEGATGNVSGPHLHLGMSRSTDYGTTHSNKNKYFFNPALYFGMQNVSTLKGKTFDGGGSPSGTYSTDTSTENTSEVVNSSSTTSSISFTNADSLVASGEYYKVTNFVGTLGDWLYGRRYRVIVDLGNNKALDLSELRCVFDVQHNIKNPTQTSKVTVYNLSPNVENQIIKSGQRVIIEAGYVGSQYGMIFIGNVIQPIRSKENGTDYKLTLVCMDCDRYTTYGLINTTLTARQTMRQAVSSLTSKSSQAVGSGYLVDTQITYPRGKVMFGMSRDYLAQISRSANAQFYTENGKVNIVSASGFKKGKILAFGPKTGLINAPQQTEIGVSCEVLLNPNVSLNTLFYLDNRKIIAREYTSGQPARYLDDEGIYRTISVHHTGDTRGDDWKTEIEAVTQAGALPSMNLTASMYGW